MNKTLKYIIQLSNLVVFGIILLSSIFNEDKFQKININDLVLLCTIFLWIQLDRDAK